MARGLRFIIVPKVAHPWFDEVHKGARAQAKILSRELGAEVVVDYMPPSIADVVEQNAVLDEAARSRPSGIAVDPVDAVGHIAAISRIRDQGIPVVLFDSPSPDASITSVGNDFAQQGVIASERLAKLIGYAGKVAVMQGYPTAPNHKERYQAQMAVLRKYPDIRIVDGGIDNDEPVVTEERRQNPRCVRPVSDGERVRPGGCAGRHVEQLADERERGHHLHEGEAGALSHWEPPKSRSASRAEVIPSRTSARAASCARRPPGRPR